MSFSFSVDGGQVKRFRTALATLAKVGAEVLVEATPEKARYLQHA
jgi:hypothetical protein